ncbi:tetratricopeptide repeat protein [Desulfovibrio psychrotolerans]|nr:tetratricopeptide repeat protein [Desulfovibrio psychrotolerans]
MMMTMMRLRGGPVCHAHLRACRLRRVAAGMLCAVLLLGLAACGGKEPELGRFNPGGTAGRYNEQAERAFARAHILWRGETCSDPDLAVTLLTEAVELEPEYAQAWLRRGLAYSDKRWYDLALEDLNRAVRLAPTPESYAYRGLVQMRLGNYLGAEQDLTTAAEMNPGYHRAWNFRAATKLLNGNVPGACEDFARGCKAGDCTGLENAKKERWCE